MVGLLLAGALRVGAAEAPGPTFDDQLANLRSPSAKTREEAVTALGNTRTRKEEATRAMGLVHRDPDFKVRIAVVKALRELRERVAIRSYVVLLQDGSPEIRADSIRGLIELYIDTGRVDALGKIRQAFSDAEGLASVPAHVRVDPTVAPAVALRLRDDEPGVRKLAALALGALRAREACAELVAALADPDSGVRAEVVTTIERTCAEPEGKALIPLLSDESGEVRNRALRAVGRLRVREAGPALRQAYDSARGRDAVLRALEALSRVGDPGQRDLFVGLMQDPDPARRRCAVEGLGRIADTSALSGLKKDYQRERNEEVKLAYNFALTLLGDRAFLDTLVLSLGSSSVGERCRDYLTEMGPTILPELYPYLADPDADVRSALARIIGEIGSSKSIEQLQPLLSDPSRKVADEATRAMEKLKRNPE